jgi:uncharacterized delta-60 repeat protein
MTADGIRRRTWLAAPAVLLLVSGLLASPAVAAPGDLDTSFGGDGRVRTSFGSEGALASTVLIRPDGKIVVAGGAGDLKFAIAQFELDGTLDTSFGGDGRATAGFGGRECTGEETDAVVDTLGRVVVAGSTGCRHGKFALARFMPDGTLDHSFGGDGKVVTAFGPGCVSRAFGVAVQSDGKIVAAGASGFCLNVKFALARYNDDGSLDVSFGGDGRITADFTPHWDIASDVAVQQDGGIVAAGTAAIERNHARFAVARFLPDGALDASFGGIGKVTTRFGDCPANGSTLDIDAGGRIVVGGWAGCFSKFALARYDDDGSLDLSFGGDGKVTTRLPGPRCSNQIDDVALQPDGKIVAAGYAVCAEDDAVFEFGLARYKPGGNLDTSFGDGGAVTTGFRGADALAQGVALQLDGKIVAAGLAGTRFALARYLGRDPVS